MDHSPLLVVVILGMCMLVESRHNKPNCDNHPTVTGAAHIVHGPYVIYKCAEPHTYNGGEHLWNCWTSQWKHNGVPMTCSLDGGWSPWGEWDDCTATCGASTHTRTRTCDNPAPLNGGANCIGSDTETQDCTFCPCPVDGEWSGWGNWGDCNPPVCPEDPVTTRTQTRVCDNPAPAYGGDYCVGSDKNTETGCTLDINTEECPSYTTVTCSSVAFAPEACEISPTATVLSVWVKNQLSVSPCTCNFSFSGMGHDVSVTRGCRAEFHVCYEP